jgi:hypothetical protein
LETEEFLRYIFGSNEGYLFLSSKHAPTDTEITIHKPFRYPESLGIALKYAAMRTDEDLYFSPMLYKVPRRRTSSVSSTSVLYADTDTFPVDQFLVPPSINIQTSPGRHASIWLLDQEYEPEAVAAASRAIALTHARTENGKQVGTDPGGWDLTQLLRMPNSTNMKYAVKGKYDGYTEPYPVFVEDDTSPMTVYTLEEITTAYDPENLPAMPERASMDMPEELPEAADVLRKITASRNLSRLYEKKPGGNEDRSQILYHFICEMLRAGFTPEEAFVGAWYAESNKYRIDGRPRDDLWAYDMRKALADPENRPRPTIDREADNSYSHPKDEGIATAVEFALLHEGEFPTRTFVDDYVAWASSKTDAPVQYHIASALTILSCLFGEWGVAPPKYGELNLGLSFVVMGETTDTRKSTTRKMMKQFLRACEDDEHSYILTSDATEEALIEALSDRPFQTSLYDRDEAQKLIADVKGGKGYMKGFLETLNELYDGFARGRLRTTKQTKEARVVFVQYLMGIRSQIQDNLELSDFASGWGPRNIYVRGESAPRTRENSLLEQQRQEDAEYSVDTKFEKLVTEMLTARDYWERKAKGERDQPYKMFFDEDAWDRMANLEWDLKDYFKDHPRYEVLRPCIDRLFTNSMKVATLFAMAKCRKTVVLEDVINVRAYVARWMEDLLIIVEGVAESLYARDIKRLEEFITERGGLVTSGSALTWAVNNGKTYQEFREMVRVLEDRNVIQSIEDKRGKISLELIKDDREG